MAHTEVADRLGPNTEETCEQMCPEDEINMRERNNLLHYFEMMPSTVHWKRPRGDRHRMVTKYSRPAAGSKDLRPIDIRPAGVLLKTVNYLIKSIACRTDRSWHFVYDFLFDRLRAVRREMVIQRIGGQKAIQILEVVARFHIYAGYWLCMEPISNFDPKINDTHTQECLKRLLLLYGQEEACRTNMAEFMSFYLLYNLDNSDALMHALTCKNIPTLRESPAFKLSLEISLAALLKNYIRVVRLCHQLAPLGACAISRHLSRIQREALQVMSCAYNSKALRFSTTDLWQLLGFSSEEEASKTCQQSGLTVSKDGVLFQRAAFNKMEKIPPQHYTFIHDALKGTPISELLQGHSIS